MARCSGGRARRAAARSGAHLRHGQHPTTRMVPRRARAVRRSGQDRARPRLRQRILGIGALLLGCAHVTGCDIDPKAPEVAAGNAALNGFYDDRFSVCAGDILADAGLRRHLGTGYDLVLANIVSDVIIPLAAHAPHFSPRAARSSARASSTGARTRCAPPSSARASRSRRMTALRSGTASRPRLRDGAAGSLTNTKPPFYAL